MAIDRTLVRPREEIVGSGAEKPPALEMPVAPPMTLERVRSLVSQLRKTADSRLRVFLDRGARDKALMRRIGGQAATGENAPADEAFRQIDARGQEMLGDLVNRIETIGKADGHADDPIAFALDAETRLIALEPFISGMEANELRQRIARFRGMSEQRPTSNVDALPDEAFEREFRELETSIHKTEALFEYSALEYKAAPFFLKRDPETLCQELRAGSEHPRNRLEIAYTQLGAIESGEPLPSSDDVLASYVSDRARAAFRLLRSERIPASERAEADRASNQLVNGAYAEAARTVEALRARLAGGEAGGIDVSRELEATAAEILEAGRDELARPELIASKAREYYAATLLDRAEAGRHKSIRERRELESRFRDWKIIGIRPMEDRDNPAATVRDSNAPVWVVLEDPGNPGKEIGAVMKFDLSDRWTRNGVTPGSESLRETVGALAQVAMGNDRAAATVSRMTEEYGRVTIMDFVHGKPCQRADDWYARKDGSVKPDLIMLAVRDFIIRRSDGAPRNLVADDDLVVPIDFGSDFGSPGSRAPKDYSSAAHFVLDKLGISAGEDAIAFLDGWESSRGRTSLAEAAALLPEDMTGFLESMDRSVAELKTVLANPPHRFPPYPEDARRDFGNFFLKRIEEESETPPIISRAGAGTDGNKTFAL